MELVLERRDHTEVAAPTANGPKKIWIRFLAGLDLPPVHGHHLRRNQVVTRGAVLIHQAAFSAAERQASNSYGRAAARCCSKSKALSRFVQIAHKRTCLGAGHAFDGVHFNSFHSGKVDHHAAIAHPESDPAMASAA